MSGVTIAGDGGFRAPLDAARAATALLDSEGRIVGWSPAAQTLLGHAARDVLGLPVGSLVVEGAEGDPALAPVPGRQDTHSRLLGVRHREGHVVRVAATLSSLTPGDGPAPGGAEAPAVRLLAMADAEEMEQWEALQAMLRRLATQSTVGLAIYDMDLRVVWTNYALTLEMADTPYAGLGPDEMTTHNKVLSHGYPGTLHEVMREVLATGEPVKELDYQGRPPSDPDRDHVWSCSYYLLQDAAGASLGVCEETVDITDRYVTQERLDLLVRAGGEVGTTLDMTRTAQELSAVTVPQFADAVTVDLFEAVLEGEQPALGPEPSGQVVRVWGDPAAPADADVRAPRPRRIAYAPDSPQARSLASGGVVQGHPEAQGPAGTGRGEGGPPAAAAPASASLAVPLRAEGATLGVVTFTWDRHTGPFEPGELAVADELVARTAVSIDNARRYAREHAAALMLQHSLLPQVLPQLTGVELAHRYLPADSKAGVGGDWFDVIPLSGTRVGMVVGDVVGHGLRAAATMGRLRTSVRALAHLDLAPDELLARLDDLVTQAANERALGTEGEGEQLPFDEAQGVTCLYAVYDPVNGSCRMARAGHPPPAVVDPTTGSVHFPDIPAGPPLGLGGLPFETVELTLPEGSLLALFTDGLVKGGRDREVDDQLDQLRGILTEHRRPLDDLCDETVTTLLPGPVGDDAALLLVRTRMLGQEQVAVWDLASDPEVVALARAAATRQVGEWGLDELAFTTELVVSELVTNAIRYASGPIQLRLIRDQTLICEISDSGHTSPHLRRSGRDDEGGRGLFLIAQMTQQWGTRYTPTGKTIWAEQALPPAHP